MTSHFHEIINILLLFLPMEIISIIVYKYKGIQSPIVKYLNFKNYNNGNPWCNNRNELIYHIFNQRKFNNFTDTIFKCKKKYGTQTFIENRKEYICDRRNYLMFTKTKDKYGIIHYPSYKWTFPNLCDKKTIIDEIKKNMILTVQEEQELYLNDKKFLIQLYFKI